jgi:hypothetical protein
MQCSSWRILSNAVQDALYYEYTLSYANAFDYA